MSATVGLGALRISQLSDALAARPALSGGVMIDTKVLLAVVLEAHGSHNSACDFIDFSADHQLPLYVNVNVRTEFLEQYRRFVLTRALVKFAWTAEKLLLPLALQKKLTLLKQSSSRKTFTLSDPELMNYRTECGRITGQGGRDLWTVVCEEPSSPHLGEIWKRVETDLSINYLSARQIGANGHLRRHIYWDEPMKLMGSHGLTSADAMTVNLFMASKFECLVTCDSELAAVAEKLNDGSKVVLLLA